MKVAPKTKRVPPTEPFSTDFSSRSNSENGPSKPNTVSSSPAPPRRRDGQTKMSSSRDRERLLENVTSLRDVATGSITEIKVWGSTPSSSSPPVQPVSSQSSTSESAHGDSPNKTPRRKTTMKKKSTSKRNLLENTVKGLRQAASGTFSAASGTITELKQWAADSTKSRPIETVSSSSSYFSNGSVVDRSPGEDLEGATQRRGITKTSSSRDAILDTVSSFRDAANETITGIKEWAAKLPQSHDATDIQAASETKMVYPKQGEEQASPERAARALYGAQIDYEPTGKYDIKPTVKKQSPSKFNLMQDLVSPFLVCGSAQAVSDDVIHHHYESNSLSRPRHGAPPSPENSWARWNPVLSALDRLDRRADSFDDSIFTFDTQDEDMEQLQRMTSWGTMGTYGTAVSQHTALTQETARTLETSDGTAVEARMMIQDDEGNMIHPVLLEKAKKRREERKRKTRKRTVKFEYPPISSLKQCPRANPEDLPNLFFTEEELDQIEDDRHSTKIADDIEIVAVSSLNRADEILSDARQGDASSSKSASLVSGAIFSNNTSTPKVRGKQRPRSPFPMRGRGRSDSQTESGEFDWNKKPPDSPTSTTARDQRLIKGVQIFLRERSTGLERRGS